MPPCPQDLLSTMRHYVCPPFLSCPGAIHFSKYTHFSTFFPPGSKNEESIPPSFPAHLCTITLLPIGLEKIWLEKLTHQFFQLLQTDSTAPL